jgi:uncharacterized protein
VRVYFDTNVLVSAFTARGLCADLLRFVLAEHELVTGEVNIEELERTLRDRFAATKREIAAALAVFVEDMVIPRPAAPSPIPARDPDDAWALASAVDSRAGMLVTGDKDLLSIAERSPIPVVSPREAWDRLRASGGVG